MGFWNVTTKRILKKLGGDKETSVIFPKTELALDTSGSPFEWRYSPAPFVLSDGQRYKVVWNGVEYVRTAVMDDSGICMIGNVSINFSDAVDTGEPFLIGYRAKDSAVIVFTLESTATVSISTETIHPIDPKYLVKTIDLDSYGIGEVILGLFASGGGMQTIPAEEFWSDVSTDGVLRLEMDYSGMRLVIDQCVRVRSGEKIEQLSFNFMVSMMNNGTVANYMNYISIIHSEGDTAVIALKTT